MLLDALLDTLRIGSSRGRVVTGAALAALFVSLGTVAALWLLRLTVHPAVPAALGAGAAAAYGVRATFAGRPRG